MASKLPAAVDQLRRHLQSAISDDADLQLADGYLLDVINSLHDDDPDSGVGETRRQTPGTGSDANRLGLDHWPQMDRRVRRSSSRLADLLKRGAPPRAETVR